MVELCGAVWSRSLSQSRGLASVRSAALQARELRQQGGNRSTTPNNWTKVRQILRQVTTLAHATCRCDSRFGWIQFAAVPRVLLPRRVFCVARMLSGFGAEFGAAVVFGVVRVWLSAARSA